jgi:isoleucyl-tRNA synthetase
VELSSIYHDVVKDRLYTDAANSPRRRSTQTAIYRMVRSLCRMLSPVIAFTADEAWGYVPGKRAASVHEEVWEPSSFSRSESERVLWGSLFQVREQVLPELEKARQAKLIGKALEAKVTLTGSHSALAEASRDSEALRELLNVSQLEIKCEGESVITTAVAKAAGEKCERCWHWETTVGSNATHPTLCGRCVGAVTG